MERKMEGFSKIATIMMAGIVIIPVVLIAVGFIALILPESRSLIAKCFGDVLAEVRRMAKAQ